MPRGARRSCEDDDQDQCCRREKCHDIQDAPPSYGCGQAPRGSKREGDPGDEPTASWAMPSLERVFSHYAVGAAGDGGPRTTWAVSVRRQTWQKLAVGLCLRWGFSKLFLLGLFAPMVTAALCPSVHHVRDETKLSASPETWYQAHNLLEPDCIASTVQPMHNSAIDTLDHAAIGDGIHDALPRVNDPPSAREYPASTRVSSPVQMPHSSPSQRSLSVSTRRPRRSAMSLVPVPGKIPVCHLFFLLFPFLAVAGAKRGVMARASYASRVCPSYKQKRGSREPWLDWAGPCFAAPKIEDHVGQETQPRHHSGQ
ncbi:hypothetical protein B0J15DRAFT_469000 [Fusarium solani]|uniref:Uncharacterized protein n=1 Tax=Fusarium solani TaxID=169388 RepID=A0A9P9KBB7_FUSSL|nr:uncharacterized protein B0J15DRAFT_469000 [Fusarium solani]KAH7246929.1 hypothetical protein B0J15DRAFT_469000 [Fusarium solani]